MFKYTKNSLKKIETIFQELGYTIRYEKGNVQSGYCMVEDRKIAVINKFFDVEGRINTLLDIIASINVDETRLEEKSLDFYKKLKKLNNIEDTASEEESSIEEEKEASEKEEIITEEGEVEAAETSIEEKTS